MPVEKLRRAMQRVVCCCECGESKFTLRRVKDEKGEKTKPAKYICVQCFKK